ncbi:caspase family protein [Amycolatopsis kentuckyensis]|uniref:caspase family protein n=1 Tax=Amycolatopsis kentuckyensis TaxID=218823 RepID=UPI0035691223
MTGAGHLLPDPKRSRVVLAGSSRYRDPGLPDLDSVRNNLSGLARVLHDPEVWGVAPEHCKIVLDPAEPGDLIDPVSAAAEEATDMLLVYYAGHGLTNRAGDLYLTVAKSVPGKPYLQVRYDDVREPIVESPATRRIIILDCCYSGRAAEKTLGGDSPYAAQAEVDGSFVLTATPANRLAQAPADQDYTAFTHEIIEVLKEGLVDGPQLISLNDLYNNVRARLRTRARPQPQARDRNNLGAQTSFRNKAFRPDAVRRDLSAEERDAESQAALERVRTACSRASADFLRRERLRDHDRLYVRRPVDRDIESAIGALAPANLRHTRRASKALSGGLVDRVAPPQLIVLSDAPGAGKTMLAVQLSRSATRFGAVLRRAGGPVADDLRSFLDAFGPDHGLAELVAARVPLVYVVDGLERADHVADQKQVIDLFRFVDRKLNRHARRHGLLAFPISVLLTIRENDWDRWFTVLEGRSMVPFRRTIPEFTPAELDTAITRYTAAYDYRLTGAVPAGARRTLALPVNLRLLSETHEYEGQVDAAEAFGEHLLAGYVRSKSESIVRLLPWLDAERLSGMLTGLAMDLMDVPEATAPVEQAVAVLARTGRIPKADAVSLLRLLIEDRILLQNSHGVQFGYPATLEYLIAAASVRRLSESGSIDSLETLTSLVAESPAVSSAAVRSNVEAIVATARPDARQLVTRHYDTSAVYTGSVLSQLRYGISRGNSPSEPELASIYGSLRTLRAEDAWNAFFVVAAVNSRQSADRIAEVFAVAWDTNPARPDRWKLLSKLRQRGLLYRDEAVERVLRSSEPREWETLLGWAGHEPDPARAFERLLAAANGALAGRIGPGPEWDQTRGLLKVLSEGRSFVDGQVF